MDKDAPVQCQSNESTKRFSEVNQIVVKVGSVFDFELYDGTIVRFKYELNHQWINVRTGESFNAPPAHQDCVEVL
jgi:hypothetical protein